MPVASGRSPVKKARAKDPRVSIPTAGPGFRGGTTAPHPLPSVVLVRTLTAFLAAPPVLLAVWAGGAWFLLGLAIIVGAALREFYGLARRTGAIVVAPVGFFLAGSLLLLSPGAELLLVSLGDISDAGAFRSSVIEVLNSSAGQRELVLTLTVVAPLVALLFRREASRDRLTGWAVTVLGAWYVTWLLGRVGALRLLDAPGEAFSGGRGWVFLVLGATWAFDTGAYFVGSRFGRTKLMPWISPGKTWEGAAGGLLLTLVVVWLASVDLAGFVPGLKAIDWRPLPIPVLHVVPMAIGIAIAAVLGDLAESMVKRDAGAKDASGFFPGHGGMFDRIDSVLFTAPFVYYYAGALLGTAG